MKLKIRSVVTLATFPIEHVYWRMARLLHQRIVARLVSVPAAKLHNWAQGVPFVSSGRQPVQRVQSAMAHANLVKVSMGPQPLFDAVRCIRALWGNCSGHTWRQATKVLKRVQPQDSQAWEAA